MFEIALFLACLVLVAIVFFLLKKISFLEEKFSSVSFGKASQSVKYGRMSEQWIPFSKNFPYSSESFRFLGQPVDGIAFEDDKIVFCEFKANSSNLSEKQKKIKQLVEAKKIEWLEFRID